MLMGCVTRATQGKKREKLVMRAKHSELSLHSLDTDLDSVTQMPGDGLGSKRLEYRAAEAIKTDILFSELELAVDR